MYRIDAVAKLKQSAEAIKARGATSLYLFGSTSRDKAGSDNDLDLFIDYDPCKKFSLMNLAAIKNLLEDRLSVTVDITTRDSLHPRLRDHIERSAIQIF